MRAIGEFALRGKFSEIFKEFIYAFGDVEELQLAYARRVHQPGAIGEAMKRTGRSCVTTFVAAGATALGCLQILLHEVVDQGRLADA